MRVYAWVALAVWAAYAPVILGWGILQWDTADQDFPYRYFLAESRAFGTVPFWNPYLGGGFPVHADPQSEFWYPPVRLLGALFGGYGYPLLHAEFVLTLTAAGWGMATLGLRRGLSPAAAGVAGATYAACGFFVSNAQHFVYMIAGACLPWLWVGTLDMLERPGIRSALTLGLWGALFVTGAYPAFVVVAAYMMGIYLLLEWRRVRAGVWIWAGVVAVVLSAGYVFSVWEARPYFSRGGAVSLQSAWVNPFPPAGALSFLSPFVADVQADEWGTDRSMINAYMGLAMLGAWFTAVWQWRRLRRWERFGVVFGLTALAAAAGRHTPLREWLYHTLPGFDLFRHPALMRVFFLLFAIPTAAAFLRPRRHAVFALAVCVPFLTVGAGMWNFDFSGAWKAWVRSDDLWGRMTLMAAAQLICAVALFKTRAAAVADVVGAVLLLQFSTVLDAAPRAEVQARLDAMPRGFACPDPHTPIGQKPPHLGPLWRNINVYYKQPYFDIYGAFKLNDYEKFKRTAYFDSALKRGWAFTAEGAGCDGQRPLYAVCADFAVPLAPAQWKCTDFTPTRFSFEIRAQDTVLFVVNQTRYPGWTAEVDGKFAPLLSVDEGRMAVRVPGGERRLTLRFDPGRLAVYERAYPYLWLAAVLGLVLLTLRKR
jgi:hypothetical protein